MEETVFLLRETSQIPWSYIVTNGTRISQNSSLIVKDYFGDFLSLIKNKQCIFPLLNRGIHPFSARLLYSLFRDMIYCHYKQVLL